MNIILLLGALFGLSSVIIAAFADHALAQYLSDKSLANIMIALRYQQSYSIVTCMIGMILPLQNNHRIQSWLTRAGYIFLMGILLFSFSIYFSFLFNCSALSYGTPLGGIFLMVGWGCLIRSALLKFGKSI